MYRNKSSWALLLVVLLGAIAGSAIGEALSGIIPLLAQSVSLAIDPPLRLDLYVVKFTFAFVFQLNLVGALGMFFAVFAYRR